MSTSRRMHAKSCRRSSRSAASPDVAAHEPVAERREDRLEREQVLLAVVDEKDARPALSWPATIRIRRAEQQLSVSTGFVM